MYTLELFDKEGNVVEIKTFNSETEAEHYGQQYQEFMERHNIGKEDR